MNTLGLASTNYNIGERGTILKDEHGIRLTSLSLSSTYLGYLQLIHVHLCQGTKLTVSVVELHAAIEAGGDGNGLARGNYHTVSYTRRNAEWYTPAPED